MVLARTRNALLPSSGRRAAHTQLLDCLKLIAVGRQHDLLLLNHGPLVGSEAHYFVIFALRGGVELLHRQRLKWRLEGLHELLYTLGVLVEYEVIELLLRADLLHYNVPVQE